MKVNDITLTAESINIIRRIQEGDSVWMIELLEKIIDVTFESDETTMTDKKKLEIIEGVRFIEKNVISVLANTEDDETTKKESHG